MRQIHENIRRSTLRLIDIFYPLFKQMLSLQTFRYAACGGINTLLDIFLFSFSYNFIIKKHQVDLGLVTLSPHIASLFLALSISLPTGFYLNRYVVFQNAGLNRRSQLLRYILVVAICIGMNYIFLKLFVDHLGWYPTPAKIATTAIVIVFSYLSQTFYFFKAKVVIPNEKV
jgi:putative flippase GtrA